jgi:hypothetical protein
MRPEIPSCRGPKPQGTSKSPLDNEHLYSENMTETGKCKTDQHAVTIPPNGSQDWKLSNRLRDNARHENATSSSEQRDSAHSRVQSSIPTLPTTSTRGEQSNFATTTQCRSYCSILKDFLIRSFAGSLWIIRFWLNFLVSKQWVDVDDVFYAWVLFLLFHIFIANSNFVYSPPITRFRSKEKQSSLCGDEFGKNSQRF